MGLLWRLFVATIGFTFLRQVIYPSLWGHSGSSRIAAAIFGVLLVRPLAGYSSAGFWLAIIGLLLAWFPYVQIFLGLLAWSTESGLRQLAEELEYPFDSKDDGLFQMEGRTKPPFWVGNVLTNARSIHPSVDKEETYYMLAFVAELPSPPPFQCSLMKGWSSPRFHDKEWRVSTIMQGDMVSLTLDDFDNREKSRETGGRADDLEDYDCAEHDDRFAPFTALVQGQNEFEKVFAGDLLEEFFESAFSSLQYEFNVTPTSVNIYTTYCGYETQRLNFELLRKLARRLGQDQ